MRPGRTLLLFAALLCCATSDFQFIDTNCVLGLISGDIQYLGGAVWFYASLADDNNATLVDFGGGASTIHISNVTVGNASQIILKVDNDVSAISFVDEGVMPPVLATNVTLDIDPERKRIGCNITVQNASAVARTIKVLFGVSTTVAWNQTVIVTQEINELPLVVTIPMQTVLPDGVKYLLVYASYNTSLSGTVCTSTPVAVSVLDDKSKIPVHPPVNVTLLDESCGDKAMSGTINVTCATQQNDVDFYIVYLRDLIVHSIGTADTVIANVSKCGPSQSSVSVYVGEIDFGSAAFDRLVAKSYSLDSGVGAEVECALYDQVYPLDPVGAVDFVDLSCTQHDIVGTANITLTGFDQCATTSNCPEMVVLSVGPNASLPALFFASNSSFGFSQLMSLRTVVWHALLSSLSTTLTLPHTATAAVSVNAQVNSEATTVFLHSVKGTCLSLSAISLPLIDAYPPATFTIHSFNDTNHTRGYVSGPLVWDTSDGADHYRVVIAQSDVQLTSLMSVRSVGASNVSPMNTSLSGLRLPPLLSPYDNQTFVVLASRTTQGVECVLEDSPPRVKINDVHQDAPRFSPSSLDWGGDTDCRAGTLSGSVVVGLPQDSVDVDSYQVTLGLTGSQVLSVGEVAVHFPSVPFNFSSIVYDTGFALFWDDPIQSSIYDLQLEVVPCPSFDYDPVIYAGYFQNASTSNTTLSCEPWTYTVHAPQTARSVLVSDLNVTSNSVLTVRLQATGPGGTAYSPPSTLNTTRVITTDHTRPSAPLEGPYMLTGSTMDISFTALSSDSVTAQVTWNSQWSDASTYSCNATSCHLDGFQAGDAVVLRLRRRSDGAVSYPTSVLVPSLSMPCDFNDTMSLWLQVSASAIAVGGLPNLAASCVSALTAALVVRSTSDGQSVSLNCDGVAGLSGGASHVCVVMSLGSVRCWGTGVAGQLGYGPNRTQVDGNEATSLDLDAVFSTVAASENHTCALDTSGHVWCWGSNQYRQLGVSGASQSFVPVRVMVAVSPVVVIATGPYHSCAITARAKLRCWGRGEFGALGYGSLLSVGGADLPILDARDVPVGSLDQFGQSTELVVAVAAARYHTCAVVASGSVYCFGWNGYGQLGTGPVSSGSTTAAYVLVPSVAVDLGSVSYNATQVVVGERHTCVLVKSRGVMCWGDAAYGQLGYSSTRSIGLTNTPRSAAAGFVAVTNTTANVTSMCAGSFHTCVIVSNGSVVCWGLGSGGQLGYGNVQTIGDNEVPAKAGFVNVTNARAVAVRVVCGANFTCALLSTNTFQCWGSNEQGQLGYEFVFENQNVTSSGVSLFPAQLPRASLANTTCDTTATAYGLSPNTSYSLALEVVNASGLVQRVFSTKVTTSQVRQPLREDIGVVRQNSTGPQSMTLVFPVPATYTTPATVTIEAMRLANHSVDWLSVVCCGDTPAFTPSLTLAIPDTATVYTITNLTANSSYIFRMVVCNIAGCALGDLSGAMQTFALSSVVVAAKLSTVSYPPLLLPSNMTAMSTNIFGGSSVVITANITDSQAQINTLTLLDMCFDFSRNATHAYLLLSGPFPLPDMVAISFANVLHSVTSLSPRYPVTWLTPANLTTNPLQPSVRRFDMGAIQYLPYYAEVFLSTAPTYVVAVPYNGVCGSDAATVARVDATRFVPVASVQGLRITQFGASYLSVTWNTTSDASAYAVGVRLTSMNSSDFSVRTLSHTDNWYVVDHLNPWDQYTIAVFPVNARCINPSPATVTGVVTPLPSSSLSIIASTHFENNITVTWSAVVNATFYRIELRNASTSAFTLLESSYTHTNYTIAGLTYGSLYYIQVTPGNLGGLAPLMQYTTFIATQPRHSLMALYNSTAGSGWTSSVSWGFESNITFCGWNGITCVNGTLTRLQLGNNNLKGSIPASVGGLGTSLTHLVINGNSLSGTLPSSIGELSALQRLLINDNGLQDELPSYLYSLTSLTYLNVQNNLIVGTISPLLAQLSQLQLLDISGNKFVGQEFGSLQFSQWNNTLQFLDVSENQLTGTVPTGIGLLQRLYHLDLSNNNLYGAVPPDLATLSVTYFSCSLNFLTTINCTGCALLEACSCSSCFPQKDSTQRSALETFYGATSSSGWTYGTSEWSPMPATLCATTATYSPIFGVTCQQKVVTAVFLPSNNLVGTLVAEVGSITTLEMIVLNNNKLTGSLPAEWSALASLRILQLADNRITGSIPADFRYLYRLQTLDIQNNQVSGSLPVLLGTNNLKFIRLSNNAIGGSIPPGYGQRLSQLVEFQMESNVLVGTIPQQIGSIGTLRTLTVSNNSLSGCLPSFKSASITTVTCYSNYIFQSVTSSVSNLLNADSCTPFKSVCGDGVRTPFEDCDDGNLIDGQLDGCDGLCKVSVGWLCQDSVRLYPWLDWRDLMVQGQSQGCNLASYSRGTTMCSQVCGDGHRTVSEQCDDGNTVMGSRGFDDGCDAGCNITRGWVCTGPAQSLSSCVEVCGNGIRTFGPAEGGPLGCDAGNSNSVEYGCFNCSTQLGYNCTDLPSGLSVCTEPCGNGLRTVSEQCDDGNLVNGDGCDSTCVKELGWNCLGGMLNRSLCAATCGDGLAVRGAGEQCDSCDGCDETCNPMNGWYCDIDTALQSTCHTVCSDRIVASSEECDDGNLDTLDGCNKCVVRFGWRWDATFAYTTCGDKVVVSVSSNGFGSEECDPPFDGCTSQCKLVDGWECTFLDDSGKFRSCSSDNLLAWQRAHDGDGIPSSRFNITERCGNGIQTVSEQCDDLGLLDIQGTMDGCYQCKQDPGWTCKVASYNSTNIYSQCFEVCGDGLQTIDEDCDDGNSVAGDGCFNCKIESGYFCFVQSGVRDRTKLLVGLSECSRLSELRVLYVSFYISTNGPNWNDNSGWTTATATDNTVSSTLNLCFWKGITCTGTSVTTINLPSNNLYGTLPDDVSQLNKLEKLLLSNNNLYGTIPAAFEFLQNLQMLNLQGNMITNIPTFLASISSLQSINLANNNIQGTLTSSALQWPLLQSLQLHANYLNGTVPWETARLPVLTVLSLYSNTLDGELFVPSTFAMPSMQQLLLQSNMFSGSFPNDGLCNSYPGLMRLDVSANALQGTLPSQVGCLQSLQSVSFGSNLLVASIPSELGTLANLISLDLRNNALVGTLPSQIGKLSGLISLDLSANALGGSVPSQLGKLRRLDTLYLHSNTFVGTVPATLNNLALSSFSCGLNYLFGTVPSSLSSCGGPFASYGSLYSSSACSYCMPMLSCSICHSHGQCYALNSTVSLSSSPSPTMSFVGITGSQTSTTSSSASRSPSPVIASPSFVPNKGTPLVYQCLCETGFSTSSGCTQCTTGRAGSLCAVCPGGTTQPCNNHGTCKGSGSKAVCECSTGWSGAACDVSSTDSTNSTKTSSASLASPSPLLLCVCVALTLLGATEFIFPFD